MLAAYPTITTAIQCIFLSPMHNLKITQQTLDSNRNFYQHCLGIRSAAWFHSLTANTYCVHITFIHEGFSLPLSLLLHNKAKASTKPANAFVSLSLPHTFYFAVHSTNLSTQRFKKSAHPAGFKIPFIIWPKRNDYQTSTTVLRTVHYAQLSFYSHLISPHFFSEPTLCILIRSWLTITFSCPLLTSSVLEKIVLRHKILIPRIPFSLCISGFTFISV